MKNYLGVDIGNSGLRVAKLDLSQNLIGETIRVHWRSSPHSPSSGQAIRKYLPGETDWLSEIESLLNCETSSEWLISSVRADALQVLLDALQQSSQAQSSHRIDYQSFSSVNYQIDVTEPSKVGVDRLLAGYASCGLTDERPMIVIQAGSAVTVDLISGSKAAGQDVFEGGAIVPGVPMMLRLLGAAADQLPQLDADELTEMPTLPGKNTEEAMICGAASALVGGVRDLVARYREKYGKTTPIILSGGDGMRIAPFLDGPLSVQQDLVLQGLMAMARAKKW